MGEYPDATVRTDKPGQSANPGNVHTAAVGSVARNEKTRQMAGFFGASEILKTFPETLSGFTTWTRTEK
jgi:hypothetical protein